MECFVCGFTKSLNPQIMLLNTDDGPEVARFCFLSVLEFGFLMKFAARRKTTFGSHVGKYFWAKCEISGACGDIPLSKF